LKALEVAGEIGASAFIGDFSPFHFAGMVHYRA
jgi:hypothetical protein